MTSTAAALARTDTLALPPAILELGAAAARAFVEYFTAEIRNRNTRAAYARAASRFLGWVEELGGGLEVVGPVHVAAYVEDLGRPKAEGGAGYATPTVKQHLSAIKMLCSFLVIRQVLPENPAAIVRAPRLVVREGKTPILEGADARWLFESIDASTPVGLRDRAFLGTMVYSFARVSAAVGLDADDYHQVGRRRMFLRLREKGGQERAIPAHHKLVELMDAYLAELGPGDGPLFRTINRRRDGYTENRLHRNEALAMVKRRCRSAGLGDRFGNHTFRGTGITAYLEGGGELEMAQWIAGHESPRTTKLYDRRTLKASVEEIERIRL